MRQVDEAIDSMLKAAQIQQPNTLAVAIAKLSQTDAQEIEDSVARQIAATEKNHILERQKAENRQTQLKNEVADSLKRLKESEAESKRKLDASIAAIESSAQAIVEKRAEARRKMEEAYPAVRSLLLPFTTPGYKQLNPKNCWEMTVDSKPVSYSGLLRTGMLVDDIKYLKIFFNMSCSYDGIHFFNDRPQGDFPLERSEFDIDNPAILNKLRKAQAFLRTHGEAMVEAKLLSP